MFQQNYPKNKIVYHVLNITGENIENEINDFISEDYYKIETELTPKEVIESLEDINLAKKSKSKSKTKTKASSKSDTNENSFKITATYNKNHDDEEETKTFLDEIKQDLKNNNILKKDKPVIFVSGHFANYELMSMEITKKNIPLATIYRPLNNFFLKILDFVDDLLIFLFPSQKDFLKLFWKLLDLEYLQ